MIQVGSTVRCELISEPLNVLEMVHQSHTDIHNRDYSAPAINKSVIRRRFSLVDLHV